MAAGTACGDASMIHFATFKAGGRAMTGFASRSRRYMVSRFTFGSCTVMAAGTTCSNASVIKLSASECACAMTQ